MSFEDFWELCPRKVAKRAARKEWDKALQFATEEQILAGMRRYAAERADENPKYTKHPRTWLSHGCWDDAPGANGHHREKGYAELADDLRREVNGTRRNSHKPREREPDLFGETLLADARPRRHH